MKKEIEEKLIKYKQDHLIHYYNNLFDIDKDKFIKDINSIDFDKLNKLINDTSAYEVGANTDSITPIKAVDKEKVKNVEHYEQIGNDLINEGALAVVTMGGGQGTRLGVNGPKGKFELNINGVQKSIFELLAKKFVGKNVPWVIMTSAENNDETVEFFKEKDNFGVKNVIFMVQNMLPMITPDGKIVVGTDGFIRFGADGNGGVYSALESSNTLNILEEMGVKYIFLCGVDNILIHPVDPLFLGMVSENNHDLASKCIIKSSPDEPVGVFCYINNVPSVIEYINISDDIKNKVDENGEYIYGDSHVLSNLLSIKLLKQLTTKPLPYYKALKKCNYMDEDFNIVRPTKANAYKYELFNFDVFKYAKDIFLLRVLRENEFSPIKNSNDKKVDCPKTATKDYLEKIKRLGEESV